MNEVARIDAIITGFSKALNLVSFDQLLTKTAALGVDSIVIVWDREFRFGRSQGTEEGNYVRRSE